MKGALTICQVSERLASYADHLKTLGLDVEEKQVRDVASCVVFIDPNEWEFHASIFDDSRPMFESDDIRRRTDAAAWAYLVACALYDGVQS